MTSKMNDGPVWFVTGCSKGLGRAIAQRVLREGYRCVVTARDVTRVEDLARAHPGQALAIAQDVADPAANAEAVKKAEEAFGRIDVLVNNAGYGYFAAIEEGEDEEVRRMFETNFFGLVDMVRRVLPGMRKRRSGHIINISSVAGLLSNPTSGYYSASKFAVNGMSEALHKEVAEHGIRVTLIEPGPTRTYFHGSSSRVTRTPNDAYAKTAGARRQQMASFSGKQPGNPDRIAEIVVEVATEADPPLHLVCGVQALERAREKMAALQKDLDTQEPRSNSADFPA
jgi:NAD(P)-dependent dehydrogenase (short-subunit alcohol dehydrogenase family)